MQDKIKLVSGRTALKASASDKVAVTLRLPDRDKLTRYALLVPSSAEEAVRFGMTAKKYADRIAGARFVIYMDKTTADAYYRYSEPVLPQLPGATDIRELASNSPFDSIERGGKAVGVIAVGNGVNLAREVYGDSADIYSVGMVSPISADYLADFASRHDMTVVLDETGFIEAKLASLGIAFTGSETLGHGYNAESLRLMLLCEEHDYTEIADEVPTREVD